MKPKFTPGPWRIEDVLGVPVPRICGSDIIHANGRERNAQGISSASYTETVCAIVGDLSLEGPMANARLIAAAPEMYDEIASLPTCGCGHPHCNKCADDERRATLLAKARGES
jgi:hypothetical protein